MIITKAEYSINSINKQVNEGQMVFDNPIQRPAGQWDLDAMSLLVASVLQGYDIPKIYAEREKREDRKNRVTSILDGKQRLTTLRAYVNNEFALAPEVVDSLVIGGREYDLGNMYFSELPQDLQDEIRSRSLEFVMIEDATEEEIEDMFNRYNNGKALSLIQRAKSELGISLSSHLREVYEHPFLLERAGLTKSQKRNEDNLKIIMQLFMILDKDHEIKSMTPSSIVKYMEELRSNYKDEKKAEYYDEIAERISRGLDYAYDATTGLPIRTITKSTHLPMYLITAIKAKEMNVPESQFGAWTVKFNDEIKMSRTDDPSSSPIAEYMQYTGEGSTRKTKFNGRLEEMQKDMEKYVSAKD